MGVLLERWEFALSIGDGWPGCSSLHQLASRWGDVLTRLQKSRAGGRRDAYRERAQRGGDVPNVPGFESLHDTE
jgi:hypothetical protein